MNPETKILRARTALLMTQPFFGTLAIQLVLVDATEDPRIQTMATDGRHLFYHAPFVDKLKGDELEFVMAHEVLHNAFEHHIRRQGRDPKRWNIAADYAINGELVETKVGKMPKGGLLEDRFTGLGAEEIYRVLDDEASDGGASGAGGDGVGGAAASGGQGDAPDPGGCGGVIDAAPAHDHAAIAQARVEMQTQVRQAAALARGANAGTLPASLQRIVDRILEAKVDWRATLRRFIDQSQTRDYAWSRPNKRMLPQGLILPSLVSDGLAHLVIAVDTSGSIDEGILSDFAAEIDGAFKDGAVDKVTVVYADAAVQAVDEFEAGDVLTIRARGGGGTRFSPTFAWISENAPDASAIVYMTDLECSDFGEQPAAPLIWAVHGDRRQVGPLIDRTPFGEGVHIAAA